MSHATASDRDLTVARRLQAGFVILVIAGVYLFAAQGAEPSVIGGLAGAVVGVIGAAVDRWTYGVERHPITRFIVGVSAAGVGAGVVWVVLEYGVVVPMGVVATGLLAAAVVHALTWASL